MKFRNKMDSFQAFRMISHSFIPKHYIVNCSLLHLFSASKRDAFNSVFISGFSVSSTTQSKARRLDPLQQLHAMAVLLIFAFSSTGLLLFDNILTSQMSQSLAHQIPDK
jgi:hypothetical protein